MDVFSNLSGIGLAALVVVLGYYMLNRLMHILIQHLERQELIGQQMLLALEACSAKLLDIQESLQDAPEVE